MFPTEIVFPALNFYTIEGKCVFLNNIQILELSETEPDIFLLCVHVTGQSHQYYNVDSEVAEKMKKAMLKNAFWR